MKIAELFAEFRIKFSDTSLKILNTTMSELKLGTLAEVFAIDQLTKRVISIGKEALQTASHFHILSDAYGINTTWLQRMQNAGLNYNVSAQQTEQTILSLQQNLAALRIGQGSASFMQAAGFFGVNLGSITSAKKLYEELQEKVPEFVKNRGKFGKAEASLLLQRMGIPVEEMQRLLGDKVTHGGSDINIMHHRQIEALTKLNSNIDILNKNAHFLAYDAIGNLVASLKVTNNILGDISNLFTIIGHPTDSLKAIGNIAWGNLRYLLQGHQSQNASPYDLPNPSYSRFQNFLNRDLNNVSVNLSQKIHITGSSNPDDIKKAVKEANKDLHKRKLLATIARTSPTRK
jgi:hypothetical protein